MSAIQQKANISQLIPFVMEKFKNRHPRTRRETFKAMLMILGSMKANSFAQLMRPFLQHPVWQVQEETLKLLICLINETRGTSQSFDSQTLVKHLNHLLCNSVVQKVRFAARETVYFLLDSMTQQQKNTHMEILYEICDKGEFYKLCDRLEIPNKQPEIFEDEDGYTDVRYAFKQHFPFLPALPHNELDQLMTDAHLIQLKHGPDVVLQSSQSVRHLGPPSGRSSSISLTEQNIGLFYHHKKDPTKLKYKL